MDSYEAVCRKVFPYEDGNHGVVVLFEDCRESLDQVLTTLPEQMRTVLRLRYGLDGTHQRTLSEVGREMGLSGSRIGETASQAVSYFRHGPRSRVLRVGLAQTRKIRQRRISMARKILNAGGTEDRLFRAEQTMGRALSTPVSQLERSEETLATLERWGLRTVGDLFLRMRRDQEERIPFHFHKLDLRDEIRQAADQFMMYQLYPG